MNDFTGNNIKTKATRIPWTPEEIALILNDYIVMLTLELKGEAFNKSAHNKKLQTFLHGRSHKSIEFKHQNISAVFAKHGLPYIIGYRPLVNYQKLLEETIIEKFCLSNTFEEALDIFTDSKIIKEDKAEEAHDYTKVLVDAPNLSETQEAKQTYKKRIPIKKNYIEQEQRNSRLGLLGEEYALNYERWRLQEAGKDSLAERIEWTAQEQGDGAGFDIHSYEYNGTDRFIEVKTTKLGERTPIYFSRNELEFSKQYSSVFYLYRLFNFSTTPNLFIKSGALNQVSRAETVSFIGRF